jgi:hypothetical protein
MRCVAGQVSARRRPTSARTEWAAALDASAEFRVSAKPIEQVTVELPLGHRCPRRYRFSHVMDIPARQVAVSSRQNAWIWSSS